MAIYRTIQMSFWTDTKVADDFTPEDRYFYLYLFTNPHTNLCGCYGVTVRQMAYETGYSTETIERLIDRFVELHNVIRYSKATKELLLLNWHKYNWTKSADFRKALLKQIEDIKTDSYRRFLTGLYDGLDTVLTPSAQGGGTTVTVTDTVTNTVTDTVNNNNNNNNTVNNTETVKAKKETKNRYGEYKNVLLTPTELAKLKEQYPDYEERIERLSGYIASKGDKYKNHYATIRNWARKDAEEQKPQQRGGHQISKTAEELDGFYNMVADWAGGANQ